MACGYRKRNHIDDDDVDDLDGGATATATYAHDETNVQHKRH